MSWVVVGAGAATLVSGAVAALVLDGILFNTDVGDADGRDVMLGVERVAAAVAAGGALATGVGLVLIATE